MSICASLYPRGLKSVSIHFHIRPHSCNRFQTTRINNGARKERAPSFRAGFGLSHAIRGASITMSRHVVARCPAHDLTTEQVDHYGEKDPALLEPGWFSMAPQPADLGSHFNLTGTRDQIPACELLSSMTGHHRWIRTPPRKFIYFIQGEFMKLDCLSQLPLQQLSIKLRRPRLD